MRSDHLHLRQLSPKVLEETSSTQLNPVSSLHPLAPTEPDKIQNLHCRPQNSTAIACSWIPPDSDFDGYSIECRKMDTQEIEFSRKLEKEKSLLNIMMLVPHKRYLVSIKVQSAGMTSEVVEDSTITMIDRKCSQRYAWDPCHMG